MVKDMKTRTAIKDATRAAAEDRQMDASAVSRPDSPAAACLPAHPRVAERGNQRCREPQEANNYRETLLI